MWEAFTLFKLYKQSFKNPYLKETLYQMCYKIPRQNIVAIEPLLHVLHIFYTTCSVMKNIFLKLWTPREVNMVYRLELMQSLLNGVNMALCFYSNIYGFTETSFRVIDS